MSINFFYLLYQYRYQILLPEDEIGIWYRCDKNPDIGIGINPITPGGRGFRTPSNFAAFGAPLTVKYIEMFHADFSYLSIY